MWSGLPPDPSPLLAGVAAAVAIVLIISGIKRVPGLGIIVGISAVIAVVWSRDDRSAELLGLGAPESWLATALWAIGLGVAIQLASVILLEPLTERLTGATHDHSAVESVRGSILALIQWLVVVWVVVALVEEVLYRGYLMTEITAGLGWGSGAEVVALIVSSVVFGLSHWYQGRAGALSTGIIGLVLGVIFLAANDLWLPILTHGVIDTVGLILIATDKVEPLQRWAR